MTELTDHVLSMGTDILWRRRFVRELKERNPSLVLDVATGSGDVASEIRKQCPEVDLVGADFCQPMLKHARAAGLKDLIVADGLQLPFSSQSFDAITVAFGLRNMACWKDALKEWHRLLKSGGSLHLLDFSQPTWEPFRSIYLVYLHKVLPKIAGVLTKQRSAYEYLSTSIDQFPHGDAMKELLLETGFKEATATPLSGGIASIYVANVSA